MVARGWGAPEMGRYWSKGTNVPFFLEYIPEV